MRPLVGIITAFMVFALSLTPANAQSSGTAVKRKDVTQRTCTRQDLIGYTFVMVAFKELPPRRESSWMKVVRYHYLRFLDDENYAAIGTNRNIESIGKLNPLLKPRKDSPETYSLSGDGILDLMIKDKVIYHFSCVVITKSKNQEFRVGDLVFRGYTRKAKSELYNLYRRWE